MVAMRTWLGAACVERNGATTRPWLVLLKAANSIFWDDEKA
jgi:hypothetical protein